MRNNRLLLLILLLGMTACRGARVNEPAVDPSRDPILYGAHTHDYPEMPVTVVKTDGSRPFTARIGGVTPTAASDLATKGYVDTAASGASATKKVLVTATDTTEDYLNPTVTAGTGITKTVLNSGADETLSLAVAYGTTGTTACVGNDSRLTDSRAPTGAAGGDLTGTYPNPTLAVDRLPKSAFTAKGQVLTGTGTTPTYGTLAVGTNGQVLMADSGQTLGVKWADPAAAVSSTLLNATAHTDTVTDTPVRGDLVVSNSTPKWTRLPKGAAYKRLRMDSAGNDPEWAYEHGHAAWQWTALGVAASGTAQLMVLSGTSGANNGAFVPVYGGTVVGFSWFHSGAHTAGTITFRVRKNGTADGTLTLTSGAAETRGSTTGTGVTFAASDYLQIEYDTSGTWDGTSGTVFAMLWVRYDA